MTRPRKQTVDWFPHSINHGRTIFTLEQRYGIAGYAFWFKLLELMGNSEGHFLNFRDDPTAKYLQAYTHTDEPMCIEILDLLAALDAIDKDLWGQKIIWSQGFVDGLAELYARRKIALPTKASILAQNNPNRELEDFIKIQEKCRKITRQAIESGTLVKGPCEICETTDKIEPHHTDYTKPFDVRWFCKSHHSAWHNCEQNALSAGLMLAETSLTRFIEVRKLARERVERVERVEEEEKPLVAGKPATPSFSPQNLAVLWNEKAPPECPRIDLPLKRKPADMEKIKDALKRNPEQAWWEKVVVTLFDRPFVRGQNDRGWKITLDVMVRDAEKILDGKYAGGKTGQPKSWGAIAESAQRRRDAQ